MNASLQYGALHLMFNLTEAQTLAYCLTSLANDYHTPMESLPEAHQRYWKGSITRNIGDYPDLKEAQEDLEWMRSTWKEERLELAHQIIGRLAPHDDAQIIALELSEDEIDPFLILLNDRRLLLSLTHHIGDNHMEAENDKLPPGPLRQILNEIFFLGAIQSVCLDTLG